MKKATIETLVRYLEKQNDDSMADIKAELETELAKGKAKADANRAVYEEIHDAVIEALTSATKPVTAQELADETGYAKGKIVYGLTNQWCDEIERIDGKVKTYVLRA